MGTAGSISCREEETSNEELRPLLVIDLRRSGEPFVGFKMLFSHGDAESCINLASVDGKTASICGTSALVRYQASGRGL